MFKFREQFYVIFVPKYKIYILNTLMNIKFINKNISSKLIIAKWDLN